MEAGDGRHEWWMHGQWVRDAAVDVSRAVVAVMEVLSAWDGEGGLQWVRQQVPAQVLLLQVGVRWTRDCGAVLGDKRTQIGPHHASRNFGGNLGRGEGDSAQAAQQASAMRMTRAGSHPFGVLLFAIHARTLLQCAW